MKKCPLCGRVGSDGSGNWIIVLPALLEAYRSRAFHKKLVTRESVSKQIGIAVSTAGKFLKQGVSAKAIEEPYPSLYKMTIRGNLLLEKLRPVLAKTSEYVQFRRQAALKRYK